MGPALRIVDERLQKKNKVARLRRQEQKTQTLAAKAEARERIARGERGDGRPKRQVSRIDYKVLANTGGRVAKEQNHQKRATIGREAG